MSTHFPFRTLSLAFVSLSLLPHANAADDASAKPSSAPPQLQILQDGPEIKPDKTPNDIKYINPNETQLKQTRKQGKVTEVEVSRGKNTYYVKPNEQVGTIRGEVQSNDVRGAQFKVFEFNTSTKKPEKKADKKSDKKADAPASDMLAPPPPPTPLPQQ